MFYRERLEKVGTIRFKSLFSFRERHNLIKYGVVSYKKSSNPNERTKLSEKAIKIMKEF
jgi:hypothetical protein